MGDKGLFPMRRSNHQAYNIFQRPDGKFEGKIFDVYRRVFAKTYPDDTIEDAIKHTKWACEAISKKQFGTYIVVDEGKEIREREEKEYLDFKKEQRKKLREGKKNA